jgi:hypothetical protein
MTMRNAPFPAFESAGRARKSDYREAAFRAAITTETGSAMIRLQKHRLDASDDGRVLQEPA